MPQPQLTPELIELLDVICHLVFADISELAALTGERTNTTAYRVENLVRLGLVSGVPHSVGRLARTRRFFPTTAGIETVAADQSTTPNALFQERPIHPEVFSGLIRRIDALVPCQCKFTG